MYSIIGKPWLRRAETISHPDTARPVATLRFQNLTDSRSVRWSVPNLWWLLAATCKTPPVAVPHSSNEDFEAVELLPRFQEMRKAEHTCHR